MFHVELHALTALDSTWHLGQKWHQMRKIPTVLHPASLAAVIASAGVS
jgi:hypothetical protein